jgi:hypothetical protein
MVDNILEKINNLGIIKVEKGQVNDDKKFKIHYLDLVFEESEEDIENEIDSATTKVMSLVPTEVFIEEIELEFDYLLDDEGEVVEILTKKIYSLLEEIARKNEVFEIEKEGLYKKIFYKIMYAQNVIRTDTRVSSNDFSIVPLNIYNKIQKSLNSNKLIKVNGEFSFVLNLFDDVDEDSILVGANPSKESGGVYLCVDPERFIEYVDGEKTKLRFGLSLVGKLTPLYRIIKLV